MTCKHVWMILTVIRLHKTADGHAAMIVDLHHIIGAVYFTIYGTIIGLL